MNLASFLGIIRRRLLALFLCLVAGLAGATLLTRSTPDTYMASARLLVNIPAARTPQEAVSGVQLSAALLESYAEVATSRTAAARIKSRLNLPDSVAAIRRNISATPRADTLLIAVSATDEDPRRAQTIADAAAAVFVETVRNFEADKLAAIEAEVFESASTAVLISPRPKINLTLGALLGLVIGAALALLLEALDRTLKTPAQATELFKAPVLGVVPRLKPVALTPTTIADAPLSPAGEVYRALRTAVRFVDPDRPLRTLLVTSPSQGEGKTTTATNFAVALAQSGERVILVDADLRRARVAELMDLPSGVGVTSVVVREIDIDDALLGWRNDLLAVLGSGPVPPNPAEIVGSQAMATLLDNLREMSDIVIIDAPPVLPVTDAVVLATQVDGVILVAQSGRTQRSHAAEARRRLDGVGANVVGCVLNGVTAAESAGYFDQYRYVAGGGATRARRFSDRLGGVGR